MRIEVEHETRYDYDAPVRLGPHLPRLRPRLDGAIAEVAYALDVDPAPSARQECLDAAGSRITRLWFDAETRHPRLHPRLAVDTGAEERMPPRIEPEESRLPVRYAAADAALLAPYLVATGADQTSDGVAAAD